MEPYDSAFSRPPAPPPLDMVQAFLNSVDLEDGPDAFESVDSLSDWIAEHLSDTATATATATTTATDVTEAGRLRAITAREALRDVVESASPGAAIAQLRDELEGIRLTLRIRDDGRPEFVPDGDAVEMLLARVATSMHESMIADVWDRLKICRNDACRWAFYDASRNHSGVWCSMATCGARAKSRRYRRKPVSGR